MYECINLSITTSHFFVPKALCYLCALEKLSWIARVNGEIVGICLCDMLETNGEANDRQKEAMQRLERTMMNHPRVLPIFEFLDVIDGRMLQDMNKIDKNHRTLHIIAAAVRQDMGGYVIT